MNKLLFCIIGFVAGVFCSVAIILMFMISFPNKNKMIPDEYTGYMTVNVGDYLEYSKYYYDSNKYFINNSLFKEIKKEDVEYTKKYFNNFSTDYLKDEKDYDFDLNCITEGDLIYVSDNSGTAASLQYHVALFDREKGTLYIVNSFC